MCEQAQFFQTQIFCRNITSQNSKNVAFRKSFLFKNGSTPNFSSYFAFCTEVHLLQKKRTSHFQHYNKDLGFFFNLRLEKIILTNVDELQIV